MATDFYSLLSKPTSPFVPTRGVAPTTPGLTFQGVPLTSGGSVGTGGRSQTVTKPNPAQQPLIDFILNALSNPSAQVSPTTLAALDQITRNPVVPFSQFEALAGPLTDSLKPGEARETQQLTDLFRKAGAGSLQSGAFASSARQLVGDQASRRNQLLASNYVPLTQQLSNNILNAIRLGLELPEASTAALKYPTTLASSLSPLSTSSETIGVSPSPSIGNGTPTYNSGGQEPFGSSLVRLMGVQNALHYGSGLF